MKLLRCFSVLLLAIFTILAHAEGATLFNTSAPISTTIPTSKEQTFENTPSSIVSPDSSFYCLDSANVLSEELKDEILIANYFLEAVCGAQFVIVTIDTTGNTQIDDYTYALFNDWGIGSAEKNNGFLLLLAIDDDNYFAAPGTGLKEQFSAAQITQFFDLYLETDFALKNYNSGVQKYFEAVFEYIVQLYDADIHIAGDSYKSNKLDVSVDDYIDRWIGTKIEFSRVIVPADIISFDIALTIKQNILTVTSYSTKMYYDIEEYAMVDGGLEFIADGSKIRLDLLDDNTLLGTIYADSDSFRFICEKASSINFKNDFDLGNLSNSDLAALIAGATDELEHRNEE